MAQIGRVNKLTIKRIRDYGAHLDGGELGDILIPARYVPAKAKAGDELEVFVFAEQDGRLRATTQKAYGAVGQFSKLRVVANNAAGSYLDWGLQKDLFVPRSEQQDRMEEGRSYLVFVSLDDDTRRIIGSSRLDKFLDLQPPYYEEGEEVYLIISEQTELGYKAIVNHTHWGVLYKNEIFRQLHPGQELKGYIKKVREDFKIDLSLQPSGYQRVDDVSQTILQVIKDHGGRIFITDKSPPEEIYAMFRVSKKIFKKAIGTLYKKRLVTITPREISLTK